MFDIFSDFSIIGALITVIPAIICIVIHELAHGYTAYRLGDPTAKMMGRLTLNPIKHIDPIGLLMMIVVRFGWAKPVPVDMRNFKKPRMGMAITAIAGPLSNIALAVFFLLVLAVISVPLANNVEVHDGYFASVQNADWITFRYLTNADPESVSEFIFQIVARAAQLSIILAAFNLLPIPPLDGSKVLLSFLPEDKYYMLMKYERYGFIILIILINTEFFRQTVGQAAFMLFFAPLYFLGVISPEFYFMVLE